MKVFTHDLHGPLNFEQIPPEIQRVCNSLLDGLRKTLNENLFGIYLYGAMVFPETRFIQDIDFHVILRRKLTTREIDAVKNLHNSLATKFPDLGNELDGYYILLSDAQIISIPWHQIYPNLPDESWPIHVAHMRAGYCIVLFGPEPCSFLPEPTWEDLVVSLKASLKHTLKYLDTHPDYCILNFCRILYSYRMKDVVVSKRTTAKWVIVSFHNWRQLVEAALRVYEREGQEQEKDRQFLESEIKNFYQFITGEIETSY
jgi:hypothetical protein